MIHRTNEDFWQDYWALPAHIRARADKQYALLRANPAHPSLHFKKVGVREGLEIWSARVTLQYRALALKYPNAYVWYWIGEHDVYDVLIQ
ncbi:MAG: hypothetical protein JO028_14435 [Acidobacteriaceae bacterium]|nr:hypothetical protein [Acidobacteriaceae bacterium]